MGAWHHTLGVDLRPDRRDLLVDNTSLLHVPIVGQYDVDVVELARASCSVGPAWVLTCACGVPGCAGVGGPVVVKHERSGVTWRLPPPLHVVLVFDTHVLRETVGMALAAASALDDEAVRGHLLIAQQRPCSWREAIALALAEMDDPHPTPYTGD